MKQITTHQFIITISDISSMDIELNIVDIKINDA